MTQEEKHILLRYLCMALPYDLQVKVKGDDEPYTLLSVHPNKNIALIGINMDGVYATSKVKIEDIRPYLRLRSSMSNEEILEYYRTQIVFQANHCAPEYFVGPESWIYLSSIHVDYQKLVLRGLAYEAPEGMYKKIKI